MMKPDNTTELSQAEILVKFIKQDPNCSEVVEITEQGKKLTPQDESLVEKISSCLIANPKDYYGNVYVTDKVKNDAKITAYLNTFANGFDFVTNAPFYFFCFNFLSFFPALILGLLTSAGVLSFSNITAATVANRSKKNRAWANVGIFGMVSISIVKSLVSGIGVELLMNRTGIQQQAVDYFVAEQIAKVEALKNLDSPQYENAKLQCEQGRAKLATMTEQDRDYDALRVDVNGLWSERDKDWSNTPLDKVPLCNRASVLETQHYAIYNQSKEALNEKLSIRAQRGNDLAFLRDEFPEVYEFHFDKDGNLRSSVTQVQMATLSFFNKLRQGDFANLGLSLFLFSLSIISSAAAVLITITYANREDVLKSRDEDFARQRDIQLEQIYKELIMENKARLDKINQEKDLS
ncbi:hypothetical protein ACN4EE_09955 [Geminocystis sp. CENA526]|uniref:hypothetical protein n=1 Tax=Geminocystis sp. CENA526 TaxID=1355871 RepID=UPI003D6F6567